MLNRVNNSRSVLDLERKFMDSYVMWKLKDLRRITQLTNKKEKEKDRQRDRGTEAIQLNSV